MKAVALLLAGPSVLREGALSAQQDSPDAARPPAEGGPVLPALGSEPFVDHGNEGSKALAEAQGISVGEATSILRRRHGAGMVRKTLVESELDGFAGVSATDDGGVIVMVKRGSALAGQAKGLAASKSGLACDNRRGVRRKTGANAAEVA